MNVSVSVRNGNFSEKLKEYANEKGTLIIENYPKITSVSIVLDMEKNRSKAEFLVRGKRIDITSEYESYDMYESIDKALEKCLTQLDKYIDKAQDHKAKAAKMKGKEEQQSSEE